jgi:hypothetical protein
MTCDNALTIMLSADLAELAPGHHGPVGQHLVGCARCRRVAAQLQADSSRLAAAVKVPASAVVPVRRPMPRPWIVGLAATAAVAIVVVATRGPVVEVHLAPEVESVSEAVVAAQPADPAPAATADVPRDTPHPRPRPAARDGHAARATLAVAFDPPAAVVAEPFEAPAPVRAVPLEATPVLAMVAGVARGDQTLPVPNPNVRVLPSPDPDITVLWFH